jgi:hypothetical protein
VGPLARFVGVVKRTVALSRSLPRPVVILIVTLALAATLGLAATITAANLAHGTSEKWFDDLWFEVAKAGVQVVAVGVLGGALAAIWRNLSAWSEGQKEQRSKVREELVELFTLYNDVKQVRRILKSHGLDLRARHRPDHPVDPHQTLTEQQSRAFREQMLALTVLQLGFESKARQFGQTNFLGKDTDRVVTLLGDIEHYLHEILKVAWEQRGWTIHAGTQVAVVSNPLQMLFRKDPFRASMSEPLREITGLINAHVFGEALAKTQLALESVVKKDEAAEDAEEPTGEEKDSEGQ